MNKALITIETLGILAALIVGGLWIYEPSGRLEPVLFVMTLVCTTMTGFIRRNLTEKNKIKEAVESSLSNFAAEIYTQIESDKKISNEELIDRIELVLRKVVDSPKLGIPESKKKETKERIIKTLSESYGINMSGIDLSSVSLAEAKPWRFESNK